MENIGNIILGIMIPFAGTTLGAACVYFMKKGIRQNVEKGLLGFASGVMVAASVWSLLIPSMNLSADLGRLAFLPAVTGFFCGILFLLFLDGHVPHLHIGCDEPEGPSCTLKKNTMLVLAVTLHNIPEGMAVGVMFAGLLTANSGITLAGAFALSVGIAIQNFPEGAIISLPLKGEGMSSNRAFLYGTLSGVNFRLLFWTISVHAACRCTIYVAIRIRHCSSQRPVPSVRAWHVQSYLFHTFQQNCLYW